MYLIVLSSLGIMTCSIALTRRFVARITSSRIVNAVYVHLAPAYRLCSCLPTMFLGILGLTCSEASSTRVPTALT